MSMTTQRLPSETTKPSYRVNTGSGVTRDVDGGFGIDASGMPALYDTSGNNILSGLGEVGNIPVMVKLGSISGATGTGIKLAVANPASATLMVHSLQIVVTTQATGANTIDAGIATNGATATDTLIDAANGQGTAPFVRNSQKDATTNGLGPQLWSSTRFLNVESKTGDITGLVADVYAVISKLPS